MTFTLRDGPLLDLLGLWRYVEEADVENWSEWCVVAQVDHEAVRKLFQNL